MSDRDTDSPRVDSEAPTLGPTSVKAPRTAREMVPGYEIEEELGRGGMGVDYQARQTTLDRRVALKMILNADHANLDDRMRFDREAKAIARLDHPNIVRIFEIGEVDEKPYFSLELITGGTLSDRLDQGPLEIEEAARLVESLARAIHVAHQADVIHRDLKPGNILMTEQGEPKITDFGLAKHLNEDGQTMTNMIMGTPSYMAPEQAAGKTREIGPGVDVYALGAILYECLVGLPPFWAPTATDIMLQVVSRPAPSPTKARKEIPKDLETICLKCMEKEPQQRYQSAKVLAEELSRFLNNEPIQARPIRTIEKIWRWAKRNPKLSGLLALFIVTHLIGLTVTIVVLIHAMSESERADQAISRQSRSALIRLADQKQSVTISSEGAFRLWRDGKVIRTFPALEQNVQCAVVGTQQRRLFVGTLEGEVLSLSLADGQIQWRKQLHEGEVRALAVSDQNRLASGGVDGKLKITDVKNGELIEEMSAAPDRVESLSFGTTDGVIHWVDQTGNLNVWNRSN